MDSAERLKLLFQGADEALLSVDVGLQDQQQQQQQQHQETQQKQEEKQVDKKQQRSSPNVTSAPSLATDCAMSSTIQDPNVLDPVESDDELFEDEYLGSFARASKSKASSKKKTVKQARDKLELTEADCYKGAGQAGSGFLPPESGAPIQYFCPIVTISRFPYKYIHGPEKNPIAAGLFDAGKFWNRIWDMYVELHP